MTKSDLAVVIVSWNVRDLLAACLRSLLADLDRSGLQAQVWVVDNGSADDTPQMVQGRFPGVHLVASEENLGFVRANNLAIRAILEETGQASPPIWLLNPDTEVGPGATAALLEALEAHPRVGAVGPALFYPDGSFQHSAFRFPGLVQLALDLVTCPPRLYHTALNGRYPRRLYEEGLPFPVDYPLGAAIMVRAETLGQVGLLDEGYWMYCEEIDLCWRMRKAGWRALCVPVARVVHHEGQSSRQVYVSSVARMWISRARLYARYHGPLARRLARAMVHAVMWRRMRRVPPERAAACRQIIQAWSQVR